MRVSSHSGVICYFNPLLTQKAATVQLQQRGNVVDWTETPGVPLSVLIQWNNYKLISNVYSHIKWLFLLWVFQSHKPENKRRRDEAEPPRTEIRLACYVKCYNTAPRSSVTFSTDFNRMSLGFHWESATSEYNINPSLSQPVFHQIPKTIWFQQHLLFESVWF